MTEAAAVASGHLVSVIRAVEWSAPDGSHPHRIIGSGVSLGEGRILTCAGVVGDAAEVLVAAAGGDTVLARIRGVDRRTNVALLDCPGVNLPAMPLAPDALLFPGDFVVAVGMGPPHLPQVSFGTVILAEGPSLGYSDADMLEVTAPVFPGFTGGALVDRSGRMVGLISGRLALPPGAQPSLPDADRVAGYLLRERVSTLDPAAVTLALPVGRALEIADELAALGYVRRGYLGVQVELAEADRAPGRKLPGVLLSSVVGNGPAGLADLFPGDVILEYAGARVRSPEDLSFLVAATVPGSTVPVAFLRKGRRTVAYVTIEQAPDLDWTPEMDAALAARSGDRTVAPLAR